ARRRRTHPVEPESRVPPRERVEHERRPLAYPAPSEPTHSRRQPAGSEQVDVVAQCDQEALAAWIASALSDARGDLGDARARRVGGRERAAVLVELGVAFVREREQAERLVEER